MMMTIRLGTFGLLWVILSIVFSTGLTSGLTGCTKASTGDGTKICFAGDCSQTSAPPEGTSPTPTPTPSPSATSPDSGIPPSAPTPTPTLSSTPPAPTPSFPPPTACSVSHEAYLAAVAAEPAVSYATSGATTCPGGRFPAFPGAEGFGACVTGGRGGRVIQVTNLDPNGPGSLKWAVDQAGPRIVVFRVSGIIDTPLEITHGDLTIAGQTSPGGITVRGILCASYGHNNDSGNCQNVIVRHLRSRPSTETTRRPRALLLDDALRLDGASDVIFDHLSLAHGEDETVQISRVARLTIQNSTLSELINPDHYWGTGMLINYSSVAHPLQDLSFHHNIWNRQQERLPEISCEQNSDDGPSSCGGGRYLNLELSNNVLFDQGFPIYYETPPDSTQGTHLNLNWVGNIAFARTSYQYGIMNQDVARNSANRNYFSDNRYTQMPSLMDIALLGCCNTFPDGGLSGSFPSMISSRHGFPGITYHSSNQMMSYAVRYMGTFPRDPMERRLLYPVSQRRIATEGRLASRMGDPCGDAFTVETPRESLQTDSDNDGMSNEWESQYSLNPAVNDSTGTSVGASRGMNGLTNIEVYLHDEHMRKMTP